MSRLARPLPAPDFLRPQRHPSTLPGLWAATGLLVLAVAAGEAHQAWQDLAEARGQAIAASRPVRTRTSAAAAAAAPAAASPAEREAARWRQRLAHPWPQVFGSAEAGTVDGVAWLVLAHAQGEALRLEGHADRAAAALSAAQALRVAVGGLGMTEVQLARVDSAPDGHRFELLALPGPAAARAVAETAQPREQAREGPRP